MFLCCVAHVCVCVASEARDFDMKGNQWDDKVRFPNGGISEWLLLVEFTSTAKKSISSILIHKLYFKCTLKMDFNCTLQKYIRIVFGALQPCYSLEVTWHTWSLKPNRLKKENTELAVHVIDHWSFHSFPSFLKTFSYGLRPIKNLFLFRFPNMNLWWIVKGWPSKKRKNPVKKFA